MTEPSITSTKHESRTLNPLIRKPHWSKRHEGYVVCLRGDKKVGEPELVSHQYPKTLTDVAAFVRLGYSLRMRVEGATDSPLISPAKIRIEGNENAIQEAIDRLTSNLPNDGRYETTYRKEQTKFRQLLLDGQAIAQCVLCRREFPSVALVASHIKPRHLCSPQEQRDIANWALMCSLGCDFLFENHYVNVVDGSVAAGNRVLTAELADRISRLIGNSVPNWQLSAKYYSEKTLNNRHIGR